MSGIECRAWWNERFPDSPPVGFMLRQAYPHRWLRIHSLPESKRFAETKEEYTELLLRHNIVATETLGEGSRCYLIQGCWGKPGERQDGWIVAIESEALDIQFGEVETIWNYRQHEGLLQEVADWKTANVIFAACDSGRIYAPYDGGADLIFSNEQERDAKRQAYQAWLSPHLEGL